MLPGFLDRRELMSVVRLVTLTPLHIGDGEVYTRFSYFVHNGYLHFIDSDAFSVLNDQQLEQLLQKLAQPVQKSAGLEDFIAAHPELRPKLAEKAKYRLPHKSGQLPIRDGIFSFIKSTKGVYIPGSEVKGALRTAILSSLLSKSPLNSQWQGLVARFPGGFKGKTEKDKLSDLENSLQALALRATDKPDAKFDLLKFLSISDSDFKEPSSVLDLAGITLVSRRSSQRGGSPQIQVCEVVKSGTEFTLTINLSSPRVIQEFLNRLNFEPPQKEQVSRLDAVFQAAYEFYQRVLDEEITFFQSVREVQIVSQLKGIRQRSQPNSPVIRLGKHQGFLSTTLACLLKSQAPDFYNDLLRRFVAKRGTYLGGYPVSRKLVSVGQKGSYLSPGWVQLKVIG